MDWITPFAAEGERLFFGSKGYLKIYSIRSITPKTNYFWYIKALSNFYLFLRGYKLYRSGDKFLHTNPIKFHTKNFFSYFYPQNLHHLQDLWVSDFRTISAYN